MEFLSLGARCDLCNRQDFLPVQCDSCAGTFCHDCSKHEHSCQKSNTTTSVMVFKCPECEDEVTSDHALALHLSTCYAELASKKKKEETKKKKRKKRPKCTQCKKKCLVRIDCRDCRLPHCVTHLNQQSHNCKAASKKESSVDTIKFLQCLGGRAARAAVLAVERKNAKQRQFSFAEEQLPPAVKC